MEESRDENYLSAEQARKLKPTEEDKIDAVLEQIFDRIEEAALNGNDSVYFLLKGEGLHLSGRIFEILRELGYEVTTVQYKFFLSIGVIVQW